MSGGDDLRSCSRFGKYRTLCIHLAMNGLHSFDCTLEFCHHEESSGMNQHQTLPGMPEIAGLS